MKTNLIFLLISTLALSATKPAVRITTVKELQMSTQSTVGSTPRFTSDHRGNPVLSWVEQTGGKAQFYYAVSTDGGQTFGPKINVPVPGNLSVHAEGMPKVAFKADGTVLALCEVPNPTPASRFAGDLLYVTSATSGQTWTTPKSINHDPTLSKSDWPANRSFSDLTRLPNGEIGIVWLDDKMPGREGRSVRFVETKPGGGLGDEVVVDDNACQCCRTNVFVDAANRIHLTYRDMAASVGSQPGARDISHVVSGGAGVGTTFTKPQVVVADNWTVNACPHTGPALTQVGDAVYATWFSGKEGDVGLRLAKIGEPALVATIHSERAKHPQVVNLNNQLVWLWDESVKKEKTGEDEPLYAQRIAVRVMTNAATVPTTYLTAEATNASYPVALATRNGLLVAYEQHEGPEKSVIMCRWVSIQ